MNNKHIRKPMPSPSRPHKVTVREVFDRLAKDQISEGKDIAQWHSDPADEGWDWAGPDERDQRLWEIK